MYKSRAVPTLTGENAEYFREIQEKMECTEAKEDWQSVGEGVKAMMRRAGNEAWGIWATIVILIPKSTRNKLNRKKTEEDERIANEIEDGRPLLTRFMIYDLKSK